MPKTLLVSTILPVLIEDKQIVYNGYKEVFINISKKLDNDLGRYMNIFTSRDINFDDKFPRISEFNKLKIKLKENDTMTELEMTVQQCMSELEQAVKECWEHGGYDEDVREEGRQEGAIFQIISLFKENIITKEIALKQLNISEDKFNEYLKIY